MFGISDQHATVQQLNDRATAWLHDTYPRIKVLSIRTFIGKYALDKHSALSEVYDENDEEITVVGTYTCHVSVGICESQYWQCVGCLLLWAE